ncbi:MAG: dihydrolipoyl dehydrogenase [Deltaproteobacteria bacterium]|nr:dihydrolipoyl dehydrogenase [Deltaproteobacteria bacterium]
MPTLDANATDFDLIILGGGPAGYSAAIKGSLQGFRVALVEQGRIGGACINRGCIPTKALWGTAVALQRLKDLKAHGIKSSGKFSFDFAVASKRQFEIMDEMVSTIRARMIKLGVRIFSARGTISKHDPTSKAANFTVALESDDKTAHSLTSRFVLVATGSRPAESPVLIADHKLVVTTDDIVLFEKLPKRLAIVGGGVVACEFASILNKFGVKVHLLEHSSQVLSAMDQEVVSKLMEYFDEDGVKVLTNTKVQILAKLRSGIKLTLDTNGTHSDLTVDCVLLAIGRKPNSEHLGLETVGAQVSPRGHILVDEKNETRCRGLYAAGDVVGGQTLAHKAWYDAIIALRAMSGEECRTNYDTVPGAIFTIPEMAAVGLQPDQARQRGLKVSIGKFEYAENAQAMCTGKIRGMVKAVIERDTGKVVGCTILGHDASNLISEVALAMHAGLTAKDIGDTIHPHPTLSEMVWESFLDTQGLSVHKK